MAKYLIKYDRENCIGAASCTTFSKRFKLDKQDGKANLVGGKEKEDIFELTVDEKELEEVKQAAQSCPVNVIHVYDEKGEKII